MSMSETASSLQVWRETRLRRDAFSLSHVVASTLASIAPAMSFFFGFALIVKGAGVAAPLTILTGVLVIALSSPGLVRRIGAYVADQ